MGNIRVYEADLFEPRHQLVKYIKLTDTQRRDLESRLWASLHEILESSSLGSTDLWELATVCHHEFGRSRLTTGRYRNQNMISQLAGCCDKLRKGLDLSAKQADYLNYISECLSHLDPQHQGWRISASH